MNTRLESDSDDSQLNRAIAALRDTPIPPGPGGDVQSATLAALRYHQAAALGWFSPRRLAQAAVIACLVGGAAAAYVAIVGHHEPYVVRPSPTPLPIRPVVDMAGSMITGEIRYDGDAPPPRLVDFGAAGCPESHHPVYDESLLVNTDDTLQNVVVSVVGPAPGQSDPTPKEPVFLNQVGCSYQPHVLAMRTGQPIFVRNLDPRLHNTHSFAVRNKAFNITQPASDVARIPSPSEPETFQVKCDIHPWMNAWLCAFDHPFFDVSRENGTFTLRGLPPGHYRLRAWHERLGVQERDMVVEPGRDETVNFVFQPVPTAPRA